MVSHRVLLKFKSAPASSELAAIATATSATYLRPLGGAGWYRLDSPTESVAQLLSAVAADPSVAKAEPDFVGKPASVRPPAVRARRPMFELPNDPFYSQQWAFENTGQTVNGLSGTPGADINAPAAWDLTTGSKNVVLLDLDTGIDYNNPDLAANVWTAPAAYTITEGGNVYNCPQGSHGFNAVDNQSGCAGQEYDNGADNGHGTITASIMGAATNNGLGIAGTDWNATILSVTICTSVCDLATAITGIDAALQIVQRFQLNLAAANFSHTVDDDGGALVDEMALATTRTGVVFAVSTGDGGGPGEPASEHASNEIAVAASDMSDNVAYWKGGGSSSGGDIAAPGVVLYSATLGDNGSNPLPWDGTSVSAPLVAGSIALVASACPLPPSAIIATIEGTADQIAALASIATNGRRLNVGNAVASCADAGHTAGTGTVQVHLYQNPYNPDTGSVNVTIAGITTSYSYDTSVDTTDSVGQGLADYLNGGPYVPATYQGNGLISLTTTAKGPYTGYTIITSISNDCDPASECGKPPTISHTGMSAGN